MRRAAALALSALACAAPAAAPEVASHDAATLLIDLQQDAVVTLRHRETGADVLLKGRGVPMLREVPAGAYFVRRWTFRAARTRAADVPADELSFFVERDRVSFLGEWAQLQSGMVSAVVIAQSARGIVASFACLCDPEIVADARERWPEAFRGRRLSYTCGGTFADAPQDAEAPPPEAIAPPYTCHFRQ